MVGLAKYSDNHFLQGIRDSDALIESVFYKQHYNMVRGLVLKRDTSGNIGVDDHYQDVMAIVFTKIKNGELKLTCKLSTYVYSIADNLLLYKIRKAGKMATSALHDYDVAEEEDQERINLDSLEIVALEMINKLRPPCNEIIFDWYIRKLDYKQIAEKHRYKNANTAKKKKGDCISEARAQAKHLLESNQIL